MQVYPQIQQVLCISIGWHAHHRSINNVIKLWVEYVQSSVSTSDISLYFDVYAQPEDEEYFVELNGIWTGDVHLGRRFVAQFLQLDPDSQSVALVCQCGMMRKRGVACKGSRRAVQDIRQQMMTAVPHWWGVGGPALHINALRAMFASCLTLLSNEMPPHHQSWLTPVRGTNPNNSFVRLLKSPFSFSLMVNI